MKERQFFLACYDGHMYQIETLKGQVWDKWIEGGAPMPNPEGVEYVAVELELKAKTIMFG